MSIREVTYYTLDCDCCGETACSRSDPVDCLEHADGFAKVGDDYLCSACWCWPEDLPDYPGDDKWAGTDDEVRSHAKHPESFDPSSTCAKCGVMVTGQTPSAFYSAHDERCGGDLSEPEER